MSLGRSATLLLSVTGPTSGMAAAALALGAVAEHLGASVPVAAAAGFGAGLGLTASPPVRAALERRSAGAGGLTSLTVACSCIAGMLTVLGLSALVPAAATTTAVYAVLLQPTRRRLAESAVIVLLASLAALGSQAVGWVDGVVPTPTALLIAVALLALTTPTVANTFDVSRRAGRTAAALERAATHDALTGLLDRRGLAGPLQSAAACAAPGAVTGVLFVDLDGFKPVNDVHGHAVGDELLSVVAGRLRECARAGDAVARTGGDEFVLVLAGLSDGDAAEEVARRVRAAVAREVVVSTGSVVSVGASVGVVTSASPRGADELLVAADAAMYAVKRARQTRQDSVR